MSHQTSPTPTLKLLLRDLQRCQAAAAAQRGLQERVRDLEVQNEELVIAKNAMLSDLMVGALCSTAEHLLNLLYA